MNVAEWITAELIKRGVTHVFTLQGGFSMYLNDAIGHSEITVHPMANEQDASWAAYGHSLGGKVGVLVVTSGMAQICALPGVVAANSGYLPLIILSGDINCADIINRDAKGLRQGGQQDVPIHKIAAPVTKAVGFCSKASQAKFLFDFYWDIAMREPRGPAWLDIPLDVQKEVV